MSKGLQLAIGATLIFGLLGWYGYTNLEGNATFQYYQTLDEFLLSVNGTAGEASNARPGSSVAGRSLRVHGYVSPGSIDRNLQAKHVTFRVERPPAQEWCRGVDALRLVSGPGNP
jgi:cytochrome c-type biogenesis protein CcmE